MKTEIKIPRSIEELVTEYNRTSSGHFFDRDTMRLFASRLTETYFTDGDSVAFFVTTEKKCFNDRTRVATVRRVSLIIDDTLWYGFKIKIETVDGLHGISLYQAKKAARELSRKTN